MRKSERGGFDRQAPELRPISYHSPVELSSWKSHLGLFLLIAGECIICTWDNLVVLVSYFPLEAALNQ